MAGDRVKSGAHGLLWYALAAVVVGLAGIWFYHHQGVVAGWGDDVINWAANVIKAATNVIIHWINHAGTKRPITTS